jgi:hypothetical protein
MVATPAIGILALPEFFQNEGIEAVLDNVQHRAGAAAIATSPYVMEPAADGEGSREPPIDGGAGSVRVLDRPIFGRTALWVRTAPSFTPDPALYSGLRYAPPVASDLTAAQGHVVGDAIRAAKRRGLAVHMQLMAAIPPGYRVQFGGPVEEDRPRLPDGALSGLRVDNNGSLASPHVRAYTRALIRDMVRAYPEIDVIRLDWPEYPPYALASWFFDFSPHALAAARRLGFDVEAMRDDAQRLYDSLTTGLTESDLVAWREPPGAHGLPRWFDRFPGFIELLRFKSALVREFLQECLATVQEAGRGRVQLMPHAFPPPWNVLSGMDYRALAPIGIEAVGVKLYTMHWMMMLRGYADAMLARQPHLAATLPRALVDLFAVSDDPAALTRLDEIRYPEPHEPHRAGSAAQRSKIRRAQVEAGATAVAAFAHGYGPLDDFRARVGTAFDAAAGHLWINRYGYLSDAKLDAIGALARATNPA